VCIYWEENLGVAFTFSLLSAFETVFLEYMLCADLASSECTLASIVLIALIALISSSIILSLEE